MKLLEPKKNQFDGFAVEQFLIWLKANDPARRFQYNDIHNCMFGCFFKEQLKRDDCIFGPMWFSYTGTDRKISYPGWAQHLEIQLVSHLVVEEEETFSIQQVQDIIDKDFRPRKVVL